MIAIDSACRTSTLSVGGLVVSQTTKAFRSETFISGPVRDRS